mmetsp:Transcript_37042/g.73310  ORF Transcript_37042/g.73310 Transcript_37042/m.73310 type:complete len:167 (+) Transcript_37042:68-568(+)
MGQSTCSRVCDCSSDEAKSLRAESQAPTTNPSAYTVADGVDSAVPQHFCDANGPQDVGPKANAMAGSPGSLAVEEHGFALTSGSRDQWHRHAQPHQSADEQLETSKTHMGGQSMSDDEELLQCDEPTEEPPEAREPSVRSSTGGRKPACGCFGSSGKRPARGQERS